MKVDKWLEIGSLYDPIENFPENLEVGRLTLKHLKELVDGIIPLSKCEKEVAKATKRKAATKRKLSESRLLKPANSSKPGIFNKGCHSKSLEKNAKLHPLAFSEPEFYCGAFDNRSFVCNTAQGPINNVAPLRQPVENAYYNGNEQCGGASYYPYDPSTYYTASPPMHESQHSVRNSPALPSTNAYNSYHANEHLSTVQEIPYQGQPQPYFGNDETVSQSYTFAVEHNNNNSAYVHNGENYCLYSAPNFPQAPYAINYEAGQHFSNFEIFHEDIWKAYLDVCDFQQTECQKMILGLNNCPEQLVSELEKSKTLDRLFSPSLYYNFDESSFRSKFWQRIKSETKSEHHHSIRRELCDTMSVGQPLDLACDSVLHSSPRSDLSFVFLARKHN
eukprot:Nk52_evm105s485 gene=Nk52_evmTU105s485